VKQHTGLLHQQIDPIATSTVYREIKARKLPAFRVAGKWRFNRSQIDLWVIERTKQAQRQLQQQKTAKTATHRRRGQ
jgi:excisionase family DNA binding protein